MPIDLTPYAEAINNALAEGSTCVVATNGPDGIPDVGYMGSTLVFDRDHVALWLRSRGEQLANLERDPAVGVAYFNRQRRIYLRLYGKATLHADGPLRQQIMARVPEVELRLDPERKGVAALIRIDRLRETFGRVHERRDGT